MCKLKDLKTPLVKATSSWAMNFCVRFQAVAKQQMKVKRQDKKLSFYLVILHVFGIQQLEYKFTCLREQFKIWAKEGCLNAKLRNSDSKRPTNSQNKFRSVTDFCSWIKRQWQTSVLLSNLILADDLIYHFWFPRKEMQFNKSKEFIA